jgi:hypothetical protein
MQEAEVGLPLTAKISDCRLMHKREDYGAVEQEKSAASRTLGFC